MEHFGQSILIEQLLKITAKFHENLIEKSLLKNTYLKICYKRHSSTTLSSWYFSRTTWLKRCIWLGNHQAGTWTKCPGLVIFSCPGVGGYRRQDKKKKTQDSGGIWVRCLKNPKNHRSNYLWEQILYDKQACCREEFNKIRKKKHLFK